MEQHSGAVEAPLEQGATTNNNNREDPYLEIELYLKKVTDEIGAVFEQWQREAALKQRYPDVVKSEEPPEAPAAGGPTLRVQPQLTPPSCSSPPASEPVAKVGGAKRPPTLLLPDLLQQPPSNGPTPAANSPTSPILQPKEVDSFLRKVQHTILGEQGSPVLDAGTQTPLSRSSSVAWLSSSQSSLGGGVDTGSSGSPFSSSEETFLSSNGPNGTAMDTSSPERESCGSSSRNGSAGDLLEGWDSKSRPPTSGRGSTPSWRGAASDNETKVRRRTKPTPSEPLHSPSSVSSLSMCPEMGVKSSSAPVLTKDEPASPGPHEAAPDHEPNQRNYPQLRSHSERHLSEIEAAEACRWMRAAGFPQYAQMYADQQFPVDLHAVQKDHPFLDKDALQALFRRLHALNKCARLQRIDGPAAAAAAAHNTERGEGVGGGDSDEEVECALSDNWMFLHQSRRWSRVSPLTEQPSPLLHRAAGPQPVVDTDLPECETEVGQADDLTDLTRVQNQLPLQRQHSSSLPPGKFKTLPTEMEAEFSSPQPFRRSGSEKLRDGAKAFLRRVESLKSRGKKAKVGCRSDEMPKIGSPQVIDVESMQERMRTLNCVELNSPEALEAGGTSHPSTVFDNANNNNNNLLFPEKEDTGAHSDSECLDRSAAWMESEEKGKQPEEKRKKKEPGKRPRKLQTKEQRSATLNLDIKIKPNKAGSKFGKSDNGGLASLSPDKEESRTSSFYEQLRRGAFARRHKELSKGSSEGSIHEEESTPSPSKKALTRWHSFGRGCAMRRPSTLPQQLAPLGGRRKGVPLASLSCGQLMVLRQLAMLKLTAMMEKHCPSLRSTGFSWELPKFMRKTGKSSQPKEGALFGVSLIACLQATGQALPKPIQAAIKHLAEHALDRVGIFRKPGVKSRIQKLRQHLISLGADEPLELALEEQQDYDVADLVKQFFRELPEALMTTKLSDTFLAIFQHVPLINRHEAMKWAVILLPDQHREVLQLLLAFLGLVASHSRHNQMTASNLAVCFAPSLFHPSGPLVSASIDSPDSASGSPRTRNSKRAKGNGSPDARELSETRAGHDCLLYLINHHEELVRVSHELLNQCHFSSLEQSIPVPLDELGTDLSQDWRGYMGACTAALLKEVKERSRGWVSVASHHQQVDLAYKKVGDGHPLRLWRATTEVEAPPAEVLNRIIREQFAWDPTLAKARVLARLESHTEVYQFANHSMRPLAPRDFTILRTWKSDLPRGGFVLVETSVEHGLSTEPLVPGAIRGIVLASRYLIEHCGSGRSRIVHLARVDTKGRSVEWYNKCYGQMCALRLSRVRGSFAQYLNSEGPESKV